MAFDEQHFRRLTLCLGLSISCGAIVALAVKVDLGNVLQTLQSAERRWVALAVLFALLPFPLRAYRWGILLEPMTQTRALDLLSLHAVGGLANSLLPGGRVGDVARGLLISKKSRISRVTGLTTVVAERTLDAIANAMLFILLSVTLGLPEFTLKLRIGNFSYVLVVLFIGALVVLIGWRPAQRAFQAVIQLRAGAITSDAARGLRGLWHVRSVTTALAISLVMWIIIGMLNYAGMFAIGIHLPLRAAFVVLFAQTISVSIPSSPGYFGTFHAATVAALSLFGVDPALSLTVALLVHSIGFALTILIGLPFLWYEGVSISGLRRAAKLV